MLCGVVISTCIVLALGAGDFRVRVAKDGHFVREGATTRTREESNSGHASSVRESLAALQSVSDHLSYLEATDEHYELQGDEPEEIRNFVLAWPSQPGVREYLENEKLHKAISLLETHRSKVASYSQIGYSAPNGTKTIDEECPCPKKTQIDSDDVTKVDVTKFEKRGNLNNSKCKAMPTCPIDVGNMEKRGGWMGRFATGYQWIIKFTHKMREGNWNALWTVISVVDTGNNGPGSCILKLIYIFYNYPGEDDFPYLPRNCGADWMYQLGSLGAASGRFALLRLPLLLLISFAATYGVGQEKR